MRIISWNWFWYVLLGFIMGGGAVYLHALIKEKTTKFNWYELLLTAIIFITFMLMGQTFIASFHEGQPRVAWLTIVFMGLPIIVMAVIVLRSYRARLTS
ncbi:hypothetical protein GCM10009347_32230 [Shewanella algicola]|uniref:Dehalogenase n=1 Tax=Shewanella algicola TaxID=640633 RepID=A0A9X1Z8I7_9GAMM|nr:hypothetical protein [Shewanella algicola]MCL1106972.1 hypothetical protein [Shewanella algicola]GGP63884.1 hypothetical protein GCM10009347_32230 [Shewanella algicola]